MLSEAKDPRLRRLTMVGLGVWALAAVAAGVGQSIALKSSEGEPRPWLLAAAVLGLGAVLLLERAAPRGSEPGGPVPMSREPLRTPWRMIGIALLALGAAGSLAAAALILFADLRFEPTTSIWAASLAASVAGALLVSRRGPGGPPTLWPRAVELLPLAVILAIATWLRLPDLAGVPANVHGDEASIGLDARRILAGDMPPVFATGWYDVPALSFTLHAATMRPFGNDLFGLRMASVVEGLLSVLLLYLLARRLWGPRPALVAAAFMAIAEWHVHFSRTGFHYMQAPLVALLTLYFVVLGIQERRAVYWLLAAGWRYSSARS